MCIGIGSFIRLRDVIAKQKVELAGLVERIEKLEKQLKAVNKPRAKTWGTRKRIWDNKYE